MPVFTSRSFREFLQNDSGAVMAEYALVLTGLTISGMLAFELIGSAGNRAVVNDTNGFQSSSLTPVQ